MMAAVERAMVRVRAIVVTMARMRGAVRARVATNKSNNDCIW